MAPRGGLSGLRIGRSGRPAGAQAVSHETEAVTHLSRVVRASGGEARFTLTALLTGLAGDGLRSNTLQEVEAALRQAGIQVDPPLTQAGAQGVVRVTLEAPETPGDAARAPLGALAPQGEVTARGEAAAQPGPAREEWGPAAQGSGALVGATAQERATAQEEATAPGGPLSGPDHPSEPGAPRRPRRGRAAVLAAGAVALVAASSAGALVIGTRSADRSAARHARLALAGAEVALDRGDPASARRLLDDAAHSNPEVAGLAAVRARLAAAERRLDEARAAYATADRQFSARHYAEAMRGFAALGDFADAPRRASQARDAARRLALAQALRALADDPAGALRWVDRSREFGDSADARQVARAARGVLGHQQAERDALARLHQVEAQLQSQSQGGGAGSSRNTSNGSSGQGGSGTGNGGWAPAGTSGGSGSGGGSRGPSGGGSNSGARPSRHG